jgi:hypothetical protein
MKFLLIIAVALAELVVIALLLYINHFYAGEAMNVYDRIALSLLVVWIGIVICYLAWSTYFYNFNFARSAAFWKKFVAKAKEYEISGEKTEAELYEELAAPRENPYKDETFGIPPGTVRGILALTILMGSISLFIGLLSQDPPLADSVFYSYFQFFEDAFLMVIAFYFGTKGLDIITRRRGDASATPLIERGVQRPTASDLMATPPEAIQPKKKSPPVVTKPQPNGKDPARLEKLSHPQPPAQIRDHQINQHYPHVKDTEKSKFLSDEDIQEFADKWKLEIPAVKSVIKVESSGRGFMKDGRPKILFEGHVFWKKLKQAGIVPETYAKQNPDILYPSWTRAHYQGGIGEYDRLERAQLIHEEAALASASWGLFQIMGYHYKSLDYPSIVEFVNLQAQNEFEHLEAFGRYIHKFNLLEALRQKDWAAFARGYNGKGYATNKYDIKLENYYRQYSQEETPVT